MLYLNHTAVQQEALIRAASEAGLRYLRMDFAVGIVLREGRTPTSPPSSASTPSPSGTACGWWARSPTRRGTSPQCPADGSSGSAHRCPPAPQHERHLARHGRPDRPPRSRHPPLGARQRARQRLRLRRRRLPTMRAGRRWPPRASGRRSRTSTIAIGGFSRLDGATSPPSCTTAANPLCRADRRRQRAPARPRQQDAGAASARSQGVLPAHGIPGPLWVTETGYPSLRRPPERPAADGRRARSGEVDHPRCARR